MFCSECGTEVKEGAVFCRKCGSRQIAVREAVVTKEMKVHDPFGMDTNEKYIKHPGERTIFVQKGECFRSMFNVVEGTFILTNMRVLFNPHLYAADVLMGILVPAAGSVAASVGAGGLEGGLKIGLIIGLTLGLVNGLFKVGRQKLSEKKMRKDIPLDDVCAVEPVERTRSKASVKIVDHAGQEHVYAFYCHGAAKSNKRGIMEKRDYVIKLIKEELQ